MSTAEAIDTGRQETGEREPETTRVITVRLPESLHLAVSEKAHECRTSINRLSVAALEHVAACAEALPAGFSGFRIDAGSITYSGDRKRSEPLRRSEASRSVAPDAAAARQADAPLAADDAERLGTPDGQYAGIC